MTGQTEPDGLLDARSLFTPKGLMLFYLSKGDTTFSDVVKDAKLPRRTVAKYLHEFLSDGIIQDRPDPHHKQKIIYSLTPAMKALSRKYLAKTVSDIMEPVKTETGRYKSLKTEYETSMKIDAKYKMVVFDMDGVLFKKPWENPSDQKVAVSSWDSLFKELDIYDQHERLKTRFTEKYPIDYHAWSEAACTVLQAKGLSKRFFDRFIKTREFINGAKETVKILKQNNIMTAIISGSFENIAAYAKKELGIDYVAASCNLKFGRSGYLDSWTISRTDYEDKVKNFRFVLSNKKIDSQNAVYVGDDVNDIPVFDEAGLSIAFNASKEKVKKASDYVVNSEDLRDILPYIEKGTMKVKNR